MKVITSHVNADFDSLSSMVAAKKLYPDATLVFPGSQEKTLRDFLIHSTLYLFDIAKLKKIEQDSVDTLVLVDTRDKTRIGDLAKVAENGKATIHVYDHHPDSENDVKADIEIVRSVGATVTILISIIRERGIKLTPEEATIMMLGIYEETGSFRFSSTTVEDFEAASYLLSQGANINLVSDMLVRELTPEQVFLLNDIIKNATVCNINGVDVVITEGSTEQYVGDLAVIVHKYRDMENVNAVFALFRMEDRIHIIGRSRIPEVDSGYVMSLFGGGGHKVAASSTVKEMTLPEAKERLIEILRNSVKPLWKAKDIMFFPVKSVDSQSPIGEALSVLTKYNINAMPVLLKDRVVGVITRQVAAKALFHKLENQPVDDYMFTEFRAVSPEDSIEAVKEKIIGGNQRFLPVVEKNELKGAITRTDLLRILEDEIAKTVLEKLEFHDKYVQRKNVRKLMEERLDDKTMGKLVDMGNLADGMGFHCYLVGGFVRDLLLRNENNDIDVVIEGDGIAFAEAMVERFNARIRSHREFSTAKILFPDGFKIDIATARLEYYRAPAALPTVEYGSLKLDLHRRDFTINTLAISLNRNTFGELVDFFSAQRDIKEKMIRVLHSLSFVEDPTRVFRAIRFEKRFGFKIGKQTLSLIKNAVKLNILDKMRGKRIWAELALILKEDAPEAVLGRLEDLGLLRFISPDIVFNREKEKLFTQIHAVYQWHEFLYQGKPIDKVQLYILGIVDNMKLSDVDAFAARMEISERFRKRTVENVEHLRVTMARFSHGMAGIKKSEVYRLLDVLSREAMLFIMAKTRSQEIKKAISNYITHHDSYRPFTTGNDLKRLGVPEGPLYKAILEDLKDAKIDLNLKTKEAESHFLELYLVERGIVT
ncbi:MAG: CBS domain-containing protein [Syntrophorhabdaceae bacterium]|nr:CBS domain-containing protein [Syntrophorhabdaceae bacterium]